MVLHELITNATKHGRLQTFGGESCGELELEHGGTAGLA
jgi:two-component sensor histidine kinase